MKTKHTGKQRIVGYFNVKKIIFEDFKKDCLLQICKANLRLSWNVLSYLHSIICTKPSLTDA